MTEETISTEQQESKEPAANPHDTFCRRARKRVIICLVLFAIHYLVLLLLWPLWDNPFGVICGVILFWWFYLFLLGYIVYLTWLPFKALYLCIRRRTRWAALGWTLVPWLLMSIIGYAHKVVPEKYLAWRRPAVVHQVQTGVLKGINGESTGEMQMHLLDMWTSSDGTIWVFRNEPDKLIIGFWTSRGMLCGSWYHIYTSDDRPPTADELDDFPENLLSTEKLAPHWYEMHIDY